MEFLGIAASWFFLFFGIGAAAGAVVGLTVLALFFLAANLLGFFGAIASFVDGARGR